MPAETTTAQGSAIVRALEVAWEDIQAAHPDTPPVVIITGQGLKANGSGRLGHFWDGRWVENVTRQARPEMFLAGEVLAKGGAAVFGVLLHEAAHGVAATRGIQDTSRDGRYHNRRFQAVAEELGLTVEKMGSHGWAQTDLSEAAAQGWGRTIEALEKTLAAHLLPVGPSASSADRGYRKAQCACGRVLRASKTELAAAPIICGLCESPYQEVQ